MRLFGGTLSNQEAIRIYMCRGRIQWRMYKDLWSLFILRPTEAVIQSTVYILVCCKDYLNYLSTADWKVISYFVGKNEED